jgi:hypothetical protein
MSQRNRVRFEEGSDSWHAAQPFGTATFETRRFGGIFHNEASLWNKEYWSVHCMTHGTHPGTKRFAKFRHAKKHLTKWVNP